MSHLAKNITQTAGVTNIVINNVFQKYLIKLRCVRTKVYTILIGNKLHAEDRCFKFWSRKSEVGSRKLQVGSRKSEVGSRKSEVGSRKSEVGSRKSLLGFRSTPKLMQVLANSKQRFPSFIELYVIKLKNQEVKIWSQ